MIAPDVLVEHALCHRLRHSDLQSFAAEGISPIVLARSAAGLYGFTARDRGIFSGTTFEFSRYVRDQSDVTNIYTTLVLTEFGDPADILGWRPGGPAGLWLNKNGIAGAEELLAPRLGEPVDVFETPMAWLRAGRQGIIITDFAKAARVLLGVSLRAASPHHARRLRVGLAMPAPIVTVRDLNVAEGRAA